MKTLISIFIAVFFLFSFQTVFAAQAYFDWEKDMDLIIEYNSESDDIYAAAALKSETNQNDQFSL